MPPDPLPELVLGTVIAANLAVFGVWHDRRWQPWMERHFVLSLGGLMHERRWHTMVTNAFSQLQPGHLFANSKSPATSRHLRAPAATLRAARPRLSACNWRGSGAGVPMEVMGLMLGDFVDDYTVKCVDVFAMPQSGTGVSVEAVDPVFQQQMLDMLKQTGRPEMVVGWYHSHPGFGCWLSGVDINTQQSFEALNQRAVAVVVDPIQSVKGKVVIDCFRTINPQMIMLGQEPRQTTSNLGHLTKPSIQALIHGLNRHYYGISLSYRKNELEMQMLENLHKKT